MEPVVEAPEEITVVSPEEVRVEITEIVSVENPEEVPIDTTEEVQVEISEVESVESPDAPAAEDVEIKEIVVAEQVENVKSKPSEKEESTISAEAKNMAIVKTAETKSTEHSKMDTDNTKIQDTNKLDIVKSTETKNKEISKTESTPEVVVLVEKITDSEPEEVKPAARITKRTKSTSSNKSVDDQTPKRKRSQSNASNKDEEETTPENRDTPSRRRAKTPTSAEVRKIVTRRVSKETGEKLEDYKTLDETLTPKRRSSRIRSKNIDDNDSVASESSVTSNKSKMSEDAGDVKPGRKGRKSVLATKTDLSVIPEVAAEETSKESSDAAEVSTGKSVSSLHKSAAAAWAGPRPASRSSRRTSAASRASVGSVTSRASTAAASDDDDDAVTHAAFDVQPIDRISLLNKTDFEGTPDIEEMHDNISPESIASDASKQRRMRMSRAASESKATPKAAKISRRISVDVAASPEQGEAGEAGEAGGRGRRASFTRACEALHTPKGRRTSTDIRRGEDEGTAESPAGSPAPSPARRPRRASTQSNTSTSSLTKSDTKRLKKMPPLEEEDKDSEKK